MKYLIMMFFAVALSLTFSPRAFASLQPYNNDIPTDPCGTIDPDRPCYAAAAGATCQKGQGYDACKTYCTCVYNQNLKKCGTNLTCKDVATSERNACLGNCITDWS